MKVVVDTSILIDYLRGGTEWEKFISAANNNAELFLPTVVIFELFSGQSTRNITESRDILDLLNQFEKVDLTEEIAKRAGELFRDTQKTLQVPDYIIAASALDLGASVFTLNKKHFEQIPNLTLYSN